MQKGGKVTFRFWKQEENFFPFFVMIKHRGKKVTMLRKLVYINLDNCSINKY